MGKMPWTVLALLYLNLATPESKARWPGTRAVVLLMYAEYWAEALAAGADTFAVMGDPPDELLRLISGLQAQYGAG